MAHETYNKILRIIPNPGVLINNDTPSGRLLQELQSDLSNTKYNQILNAILSNDPIFWQILCFGAPTNQQPMEKEKKPSKYTHI